LDQIDCDEVDASKVTLRLREILANAESRLTALTKSLAEQNEACMALQEKITVCQYDVTHRVEQLTAKQDVIKALESRLPDQTELRSINDHLSDYHSMLAIHNELTQRLEGLRVIPGDEKSLQLPDLLNEDSPAIETAESISAVPDHEDISAPLMIAVIDDRIVRCPIKEGNFTIGRDIGNDFRLFTKFVSRRHACIVTRGRDSSIEDLGSKNGVLVNTDRIQRCRLKNGDRIDIGGIQFKFIDSGSDSAGNTF